MEKPLWAWLFWAGLPDTAWKGNSSALGGLLMPADLAEFLPT